MNRLKGGKPEQPFGLSPSQQTLESNRNEVRCGNAEDADQECEVGPGGGG